MRKLLVFKHVAQENLGSLATPLKAHGFRIRYVNFYRDPEADAPAMEKYNGLIVLGGWMGVYEADQYPHLKLEYKKIEEALKLEIPVLGICLGAQILAHVLGAEVRKHTEKEVGWQDVEILPEGQADPLLAHFQAKEKVFQMHGDTFAIPKGAVHLARSNTCAGQAFRYGAKAYGLQFHLEADQVMIDRFLRIPWNRLELEKFGGTSAVSQMERETCQYLPRSLDLSKQTFQGFIDLFGLEKRSQFSWSKQRHD